MKKTPFTIAVLLVIFTICNLKAQAPFGVPPSGANQTRTPDAFYDELSSLSSGSSLTWLAWSTCTNWPERLPIVACPTVTNADCKIGEIDRTGNDIYYSFINDHTYKAIVWDGCNPSFSFQVTNSSGNVEDELIVSLKGAQYGIITDPDIIVQGEPGQPGQPEDAYINIIAVYELDKQYVAMEIWEYDVSTTNMKTKVFYGSKQDIVISHDNLSFPTFESHSPNIDGNNTNKIAITYYDKDITTSYGLNTVVCALYNPNIPSASPLGAFNKFFVRHSQADGGLDNTHPDVTISDDATFTSIVSLAYYNEENKLIIVQEEFNALWSNVNPTYFFTKFNSDYETNSDPRICSPSSSTMTHEYEVAISITDLYDDIAIVDNFMHPSSPAFDYRDITNSSILTQCINEYPAIAYGSKNKVVVGWNTTLGCIYGSKAVAANFDFYTHAKIPNDPDYFMEININSNNYLGQKAVSLAENSILVDPESFDDYTINTYEVFYSNIGYNPETQYNPTARYEDAIFHKISAPPFQPMLRKREQQSSYSQLEKTEDFSFYPNPTNEHLNLTLNTSDKVVQFRIFDIKGKLQMKNPISINSQTNSIDLSILSPGVYFIELKTSTKTYREKLIIN